MRNGNGYGRSMCYPWRWMMDDAMGNPNRWPFVYCFMCTHVYCPPCIYYTIHDLTVPATDATDAMDNDRGASMTGTRVSNTSPRCQNFFQPTKKKKQLTPRRTDVVSTERSGGIKTRYEYLLRVSMRCGNGERGGERGPTDKRPKKPDPGKDRVRPCGIRVYSPWPFRYNTRPNKNIYWGDVRDDGRSSVRCENITIFIPAK